LLERPRQTPPSSTVLLRRPRYARRAWLKAAGIEARAKALATNQDAVIAQQIAENYPSIVAAAASSLSNIDNLVVLNGAEGMEDMLPRP